MAFPEQKPLAVVDPFAQLKSKLGQVRWADESDDDDEPAPSVENRGRAGRKENVLPMPAPPPPPPPQYMEPARSDASPCAPGMTQSESSCSGSPDSQEQRIAMERERQRLKSQAILYQSERLDEIVPRNKTRQMRWVEAQTHGWYPDNIVRRGNLFFRNAKPASCPLPQKQAPAAPLLTAANLSLYDYTPGRVATPQCIDNMSEASFFTNRWLPPGFSDDASAESYA